MEMIEKVVDVLKTAYTIPSVLLKEYKKLNINDNELIVLIYLLNQKDMEFNPAKISKEFNSKR